MDVYPRSFTKLTRVLFPIKSYVNRNRMVASMLIIFITSCPYLLLKVAVVKLFGKLLKILGRIATFYSYQVFPFEICKIFINSRFSEHCHGLAFAKTYCLQREKVVKNFRRK